ncbi:MAG: hypothetical protein WCL57_10705 [Chloroflexota bacterium]|nr:hypothetical protein [Chloroflexota bacterium]
MEQPARIPCRWAGPNRPQAASNSVESLLDEVAFALATGLATNTLWYLNKLAIAATLQGQQRPVRATEIVAIDRPNSGKITIVQMRE